MPMPIPSIGECEPDVTSPPPSIGIPCRGIARSVIVKATSRSAGLGWACALDTGFTGADRLREIKEQGPAQKLVPFRMTERAIPRQGMPIEGGGEVTSGSLSPMLDVGIGLGYVPATAAKAGTEIVVDVRGRPRRGEIVKKPIYKKES